MNRLLAEAFGTFCVVFAGTGAIVVHETAGGTVSHVGIAVTFGLVVAAMIYAVGDVSGAHLNPAVSIAFALSGRFGWTSVPRYVAAQILGAIVASALLRALFPTSVTLGATIPSGPPLQSFLLEIVLAFILMLVVLRVSSGSREHGAMAGLAIGAVIAFEAMFAGPISGASMNPARSLAPALISGAFGHLWVYLVAPVLGASLAIPFARALESGLDGSAAVPCNVA